MLAPATPLAFPADAEAATAAVAAAGPVEMTIGYDAAEAPNVERAADLVVSMGGSLSGEHGDGQSRGELLERMYGPELVDAFRQFKSVFDPRGRMNPGKVVDAYPLDTNLRFGPGHRTARHGKQFFALADDGGSLQTAAERCVGVGRCRRDDAGTMCSRAAVMVCRMPIVALPPRSASSLGRR